MSSRLGKRSCGEPVIEGRSSSQTFYNPSEIPNPAMINTIIINPEDDERPHAEISVLGKKLRGLLDSGASCSLLGGNAIKIIEELNLRKGDARARSKQWIEQRTA